MSGGVASQFIRWLKVSDEKIFQHEEDPKVVETKDMETCFAREIKIN